MRVIFVSCCLKVLTNHNQSVICLTCYVDTITNTKSNNHALEPLTNKFNTQRITRALSFPHFIDWNQY